MKYLKKLCYVLLYLAVPLVSFAQSNHQWSVARANTWYAKEGWRVGANFTPAYAINQLEFWQTETFDLTAIGKELDLAEGLGLTTLRVYLHDLAWKQDPEGFKKRINAFLKSTNRHHIKPVFVFFDDCWNANGAIGKQPAPQPGVHNSGWLRSPLQPVHNDPTQWAYLKVYVQDILKSFKEDKRILFWDLYNEPGNSGYGDQSLALLESVFSWAREVNPSQPLTAGVWADNLKATKAFMLQNSDIVSYHSYDLPQVHQKRIDELKKIGRPLICTEYMARRNGSTFQNTLPLLKEQNITAINWGLVDGKTNTKYAWDEPIKDGSEPKLWFHEIFKRDGTPYKKEETDLIRSLTQKH